jgi:deoxycytidine triphosphate deaminase
MGLKPDHWIRKMALEHGMIDPFVEKQTSAGVISYGVSSYGYDMRVADEFRIFTNVHSTVVDPKNFSPKSMVEYQGDVCIIPPNSFALARSVEYFRIPRGVLTLTVGKSTYARCFRGDTRVALVDGRSLSLEEMAQRAETGEMFFGYSVGPFGRIMVTLLEAPRYIGRDSLIEIVLDNDESIFCTPDHHFILRDGRSLEAGQLRPGASLMPLYRQIARGYEMLYQPLNGQLHPTHRLADEWNLRHEMYADTPGTHRHHIDYDRLNNNPSNIARVETVEIHEDGLVLSRHLNHKVVAVRELPGDHDVYCLTVPEAGNFALEAGVFVHNCGIITNITPFEPGWEGFVTLEISNTTPLPAKIYANEGIAQVIFLEADEECEVSYADRKGKYQGQTGVTPPRL